MDIKGAILQLGNQWMIRVTVGGEVVQSPLLDSEAKVTQWYCHEAYPQVLSAIWLKDYNNLPLW